MEHLQQHTGYKTDYYPAQATDPHIIIQEFFRCYGLPECRNLLREILHQALSGYHTREGIHPADLLRFLEELEKATEAMYRIGVEKLYHKGEEDLNC
jgi:hypothetical protein